MTILIVATVAYSLIVRAEEGRLGPVIAAVVLLLGVWVWSLWVNREKVKSFLSRFFTFSLTRTDIIGKRRERRFVRKGTPTYRLANAMIAISYVLVGIVAIVSIINKIKGSDEFAVWEIVFVMVGFVLIILGRSLEYIRRAFVKLLRIIKK
jgi:hypothetical protein